MNRDRDLTIVTAQQPISETRLILAEIAVMQTPQQRQIMVGGPGRDPPASHAVIRRCVGRDLKSEVNNLAQRKQGGGYDHGGCPDHARRASE